VWFSVPFFELLEFRFSFILILLLKCNNVWICYHWSLYAFVSSFMGDTCNSKWLYVSISKEITPCSWVLSQALSFVPCRNFLPFRKLENTPLCPTVIQINLVNKFLLCFYNQLHIVILWTWGTSNMLFFLGVLTKICMILSLALFPENFIVICLSTLMISWHY